MSNQIPCECCGRLLKQARSVRLRTSEDQDIQWAFSKLGEEYYGKLNRLWDRTKSVAELTKAERERMLQISQGKLLRLPFQRSYVCEYCYKFLSKLSPAVRIKFLAYINGMWWEMEERSAFKAPKVDYSRWKGSKTRKDNERKRDEMLAEHAKRMGNSS